MADLQTVMNTAPSLTLNSNGIPYTRLTCPFCQWIDANGITTWRQLRDALIAHRDNRRVLGFCFWVRATIPQALTDQQKLYFTIAICQSRILMKRAWNLRQAGRAFTDLTTDEVSYIRSVINA